MARTMTIEEVMDEIYAQYHSPEIESDEFTSMQFADREGLTWQKAEETLKRAAAQGRVTRIDKIVVANNHRYTHVWKATPTITEGSGPIHMISA